MNTNKKQFKWQLINSMLWESPKKLTLKNLITWHKLVYNPRVKSITIFRFPAFFFFFCSSNLFLAVIKVRSPSEWSVWVMNSFLLAKLKQGQQILHPICKRVYLSIWAPHFCTLPVMINFKFFFCVPPLMISHGFQ
jgi:hypothetical protein